MVQLALRHKHLIAGNNCSVHALCCCRGEGGLHVEKLRDWSFEARAFLQMHPGTGMSRSVLTCCCRKDCACAVQSCKSKLNSGHMAMSRLMYLSLPATLNSMSTCVFVPLKLLLHRMGMLPPMICSLSFIMSRMDCVPKAPYASDMLIVMQVSPDLLGQ